MNEHEQHLSRARYDCELVAANTNSERISVITGRLGASDVFRSFRATLSLAQQRNEQQKIIAAAFERVYSNLERVQALTQAMAHGESDVLTAFSNEIMPQFVRCGLLPPQRHRDDALGAAGIDLITKWISNFIDKTKTDSESIQELRAYDQCFERISFPDTIEDLEKSLRWCGVSGAIEIGAPPSRFYCYICKSSETESRELATIGDACLHNEHGADFGCRCKLWMHRECMLQFVLSQAKPVVPEDFEHDLSSPGKHEFRCPTCSGLFCISRLQFFKPEHKESKEPAAEEEKEKEEKKEASTTNVDRPVRVETPTETLRSPSRKRDSSVVAEDANTDHPSLRRRLHLEFSPPPPPREPSTPPNASAPAQKRRRRDSPQ